MKKLDVGEKYLTVYLFGGQIKLVAFRNKDKKNPKEPDYKSSDVAIWISTKKAPKETPVNTQTDNL